MTPIVECCCLTGGYQGLPVVRSLNLVVYPGEVVALLGANGSGKSTTLLTLAGILPPITGEVRFAGKSVTGMRAHGLARRGLCLVPDNRGVLFDLTTAENISLGVGYRRRRQGIDTAVQLFPALAPKLTVRAGALSGGEQQMLAVARAVARRPRALMIDELSLGLAPTIVTSLLPTLRTVARDDGVGVLLVEQHVDLALGTADRAYILRHGSVVASGPAADIRRDTELLRTGYLGDAGGPSPAHGPTDDRAVNDGASDR